MFPTRASSTSASLALCLRVRKRSILQTESLNSFTLDRKDAKIACALQRLPHLAFIEKSLVTRVRELHEGARLRVHGKQMKISFK